MSRSMAGSAGTGAAGGRLGGNVGRGERVEAGELVQEQQLPDTEF